MTQKEFYNLDIVKRGIELQKQNPYKSEPHFRGYVMIVKAMAEHVGKEDAIEFYNEY